jgi:hypothetical protein
MGIKLIQDKIRERDTLSEKKLSCIVETKAI